MSARSSKARSGRVLAGLLLAALAAGAAAPAGAATTTPTQRQLVQHLLRRFAFSASPAAVDAVLAQGPSAWVAQQLKWQSIDDSKSQLNHPPGGYINPGTCGFCLPNYYAFEAMVYQHDLLTNRQIQAKMELHWLDHFSINQSQLDMPSMYDYDQAVRANALGNFAKLVSSVAVTPAMLWWLDNDGNNSQGPNVNWARELMQLYTIGEWQLNPDGSQVLDKNGQPIPNYAEADIHAMAQAMSGYHTVFLGGSDPMTNYIVVFNGQQQRSGKITFLGASHAIPAASNAIETVVNVLAHHPSAAPFQVTELLKRFVTETPSPQFISDIVQVWNRTVDAPDQLAQVVQAIINHPDFAAAYHAMPKQPVERVLGLLRQLPGQMQAAPPAGVTWQPYHAAGQSLESYMSALDQEIFYPPNVFSFYLPGHVESMTTTASTVGATWVYSQLLQGSPSTSTSGTSADVWIDIPTLQTTVGPNGDAMAKYLLDALVDGGSPQLQGVVRNFLGSQPSPSTIQDAIWLICNSPEYAVN